MASDGSDKPLKLKYKALGGSGLRVSEICLGCMTFGQGAWGMPTETDESKVFAILDRFRSVGGNFVDTADVYGSGASEKVLGKWLKTTSARDEIIIATKALGTMGPHPNDAGLSRRHLVAALEGSLERLQTNYIDLYQMHGWDKSTPIKETLTTLNDFVRSGKVRYLGGSNYAAWHLQKTQDLANASGLERFVSMQQQYSLLERNYELDLEDVCRNEGVACLPWSPLKGGWLTGKYQKETTPAAGTRAAWADSFGFTETSSAQATDRLWSTLDALTRIASTKTVPASAGLATSTAPVSAVALRWLMQKPTVAAPIIGAKSIEQLDQNLSAAWIELSEAEMKELDGLTGWEGRGGKPYPYNMIDLQNAMFGGSHPSTHPAMSSQRGSRTPSTRPPLATSTHRPRPISSAADQEPLLAVSSPLNYLPTVEDPSSPSQRAALRRRLRNADGPQRTWSEWLAGLLVSSHASSAGPSLNPLSASSSSSSLSSFPAANAVPRHHRLRNPSAVGVGVGGRDPGFPRTVVLARSQLQQKPLCQRCLRPLLLVLLVAVVLLIAVSNRRLIIPGDDPDAPPDGDGGGGGGGAWRRDRLPTALMPLEYRLDVEADPEAEGFLGKVVVELKALATTTNITLHAVGLSFGVENVTIVVARDAPSTPGGGGGGGDHPVENPGPLRTPKSPPTASPSPPPNSPPAEFAPKSMVSISGTDMIAFMLPSTLFPADRVTLTIRYNGTLGYDTARGFFRSPYTVASPTLHRRTHKKKPPPPTTQHLAATHFEPHSARLAYPCLDEPHLKAPFVITVTAPSQLEAASNAPVEKVETVEGRKGWKRWRFAKTRPMSTYLAAWAVGDVRAGARGSGGKANVPVRVFAVPGMEKRAVFALDVALASIALYESRFTVPFPFPKLDLFPIPNFPGEGMENPGLAIIALQALLPPASAPPPFRLYASNLIAHEVAHMWLGDLVTMRTWEDLWLNEGFAEWAQWDGTEAAHPAWKAGDMFWEDEAVVGMEKDGGFWGRAVRPARVLERNVGAMFDDIVYNKGAAVIRMIQSWLDRAEIVYPTTPSLTNRTDALPPAPPEEVCGRFCRSLKRYLTKHAESVATTDDLLAALDAEEPSGLISTVVRPWLFQPGHPVVSVDLATGVFSQQPFTLWHTLAPSANTSWHIPFSYRYVSRDTSADGMAPPAANVSRTVLIKPDGSARLPPAGPEIADPLLLANAERVGYYRFLHAEASYVAYAALLSAHPTVVPAPGRAGLVSDTVAMLLSGRLAPRPALTLLGYLSHERDAAVWRAAGGALRRLADALEPHAAFPAFRRFALEVASPCVDEVGFPLPNATGDFRTGLLRPAVLGVAVRFGRPATLAACFDLLVEVTRGGKVALPEFLAGVAQAVVEGAVRFDAFRAVDAVMADWGAAVAAFGFEAVVAGVAASPHRAHHEMLIEAATEEGEVPDPEVLVALAGGSESGHVVAWRRVVARWDALVAARGGSRHLGYAVEALVARMDDQGAEFVEAVGLVQGRKGGAGDGGVGLERWRVPAEREAAVVTAVRRGLERAWAAGEFRRVMGEEVGNVAKELAM
ncbi:hypothetical protein HDU96_005520 [Phlyctochytrium bullatum]|nr:hypothetical protein HDU96_005520 [Phlyctochytrium bullatum]